MHTVIVEKEITTLGQINEQGKNKERTRNKRKLKEIIHDRVNLFMHNFFSLYLSFVSALSFSLFYCCNFLLYNNHKHKRIKI